MPTKDKRIVLIADDDPGALELIQTVLDGQGFDLVTATDGRQAIDQVVNLQPDMVLLDVMMPEVDGYAVCRHIKNNDLLKRIKVILYSAKEKVKGKAVAKEVGAEAFLPKPFDTKELLQLMKDLFVEQDKESRQLAKKLNL